MGTPELTPYQKYQNFRRSDPKFNKMPPTVILSIMKNQNIITEAEFAQLKLNPIVLTNGDSQEYLVIRHPTKKTEDSPYIKLQKYIKPKTYNHPLIEGVVCNEDGTIPREQFSLKALKQKFNSKKYDIIQEDNGNLITVIDKSTGINVAVVRNHHMFKKVDINKENERKSFFINSKNKLYLLSIEKDEKDKTINTNYNENLKIDRIDEYYYDGSRILSNYDTKTGKIRFKEYWEPDANMATHTIDYTNGIPWKERQGKETTYPLVDDLIEGFNTKNKIGFTTLGKNLVSDILKRINYENVTIIAEEFYKRTGENLLDVIKSNRNIDTKTKNKCIEHLEKLYAKNFEGKKAGKFLASQLYQDINNKDKNTLIKHLNLLNDDNFIHTMLAYRQLSYDIQRRVEDGNDKSHRKRTQDTINKYSIEPLCTIYTDNLIKNAMPFQGLLEAIDSNELLTDYQKHFYINKITQMAMSMRNEWAIECAKRDIASHPNDYHKVEVDLYRIYNTKVEDSRNPNIGEIRTDEVEGFLDSVRKQGRTGDCWLIAVLNSIIAKPNLLKRLEKLIEYDDTTGNYTINFKGAKVQYTVTAEEIDKNGLLSKGSRRLRALEIAFDKHAKELAYNDRYMTQYYDDEFEHTSQCDINGNSPMVAYRTLFDDVDFSSHPDILTVDFNNPNNSYTIDFYKIPEEYNASSEKDDIYTFTDRHEYSIIGSDETNVFILNPHDSSDIVTISREELSKFGCGILCCEFPEEMA